MRISGLGRRRAYQLGSVGVLLLLIIAGIGGRPGTAQADPHAMFYTAIGQRQLFFNMLAALDQADYVEPATGENSRQQLAQQRDAAGFRPLSPEGSPIPDKPTVTETRTELPSILTRSITLEGYDMWTAYLERQFALEAKRRRDVDEILRIICTINSGHENCTDTQSEPRLSNTGESDEFETEPEQARVVDPRQAGEAVTLAGRLVLASDLAPESDFQKYLRRVLLGTLTKIYTLPVPIDLPIALLRERLAQRDPDDPFTRTVDDLLAHQMNLATAPAVAGVDPSFFDDFGVDEETGDIVINVGETSTLTAGTVDSLPQAVIQTTTEGAKLDILTSKLGALAGDWIYDRVALAEDKVRAVTARNAGDFQPTTVTVPRVKPPECHDDDGDGEPDRCDPPQLPVGSIVGVNTQIKTPASNKLALAEAAANALVGAAQQQATANAVEESVVGETELVYREPVEEDDSGSVSGIQDTADQAGRVLHTIDDATFREDLERRLSSGEFSVNPAVAEQGPAHVLSVLFGKARGNNEGCGCSLRGSVSAHGPSISSILGG